MANQYKMKKKSSESPSHKDSKTYKSTPDLFSLRNSQCSSLGHVWERKKEQLKEELQSLNGLYRTGPSQIQEENLCILHSPRLLFRSPPYELG